MHDVKQKRKELTSIRRERDDLKAQEEQESQTIVDQAEEIDRLQNELAARDEAEIRKDARLSNVQNDLNRLIAERGSAANDKRRLDDEREQLAKERSEVSNLRDGLAKKINDIEDAQERLDQLRTDISVERKGPRTREASLQKRLLTTHQLSQEARTKITIQQEALAVSEEEVKRKEQCLTKDLEV